MAGVGEAEAGHGFEAVFADFEREAEAAVGQLFARLVRVEDGALPDPLRLVVVEVDPDGREAPAPRHRKAGTQVLLRVPIGRGLEITVGNAQVRDARGVEIALVPALVVERDNVPISIVAVQMKRIDAAVRAGAAVRRKIVELHRPPVRHRDPERVEGFPFGGGERVRPKTQALAERHQID